MASAEIGTPLRRSPGASKRHHALWVYRTAGKRDVRSASRRGVGNFPSQGGDEKTLMVLLPETVLTFSLT